MANRLNTNNGSGLIIAEDSAQTVSFHGATPIIQGASTGEATGFTAVGGTAVQHQSTFTGNTGSKAYTLNDIVKHLKNKGLLAAS